MSAAAAAAAAAAAPAAPAAAPPEGGPARVDDPTPATDGQAAEEGAGEGAPPPPGAAATAGGRGVEREGSAGERQEARHVCRGARGTCTLVAITALFVLALYWAADSWTSIRSRSLKWVDTDCVIGEGGGAERGPSLGVQSSLWRSRLNVSFHAAPGAAKGAPPIAALGAGPSDADRPGQMTVSGIVAWRYGRRVYNVSEAEARRYSATFAVGDTYPCWVVRDGEEGGTGAEAVAGNDGWRASLTAIADESAPAVDLALVSTCVAGVLLASFLIALLYAISAVEPADRPPATPPRGTVQPHALSEAQVGRICAVAAEAAARDAEVGEMFDGDTWDCAICLDDEGGDGGRLAQLACRHVFHLVCVRGWLMRGGVTCPLCNYRLRPVDEDEYAKAKAAALDEADGATAGAAPAEGALGGLPDIALALIGLTAPPEAAYREPADRSAGACGSGSGGSRGGGEGAGGAPVVSGAAPAADAGAGASTVGRREGGGGGAAAGAHAALAKAREAHGAGSGETLRPSGTSTAPCGEGGGVAVAIAIADAGETDGGGSSAGEGEKFEWPTAGYQRQPSSKREPY
jgi:hypothetical protein